MPSDEISDIADDTGSPPDLSNLVVAVRVRPLNAEERSRGSPQIVYKVDDKMVVLMDPGDRWDEFLRNKRVREKKYLFDVAIGPSATQEEAYVKTTKSVIESVLSGFNATVFAYGATGAGKTYTMLGTDENPGIMARALDELFRKMDSGQRDHIYDVRMSYLEIYNEMIRDLLHPSSGILDLREDSKGTILVHGLSETQAKSSREVQDSRTLTSYGFSHYCRSKSIEQLLPFLTQKVLQLLMQGNRRRTQEPTAANKTSSRSHAVLQVIVTQKKRVRNLKDEVRVGKLFLIDLAGSERASRTKNRGKRMKEGAHINRSLLALGNVINTLTEKGSKYVNYRDSKLTRILKDSLGGNSRTVMIAHISPASRHFEESRNTLIYADRAKNITTKLLRNTQEVTHHVTQYQSIIAELRKEISRLKSKIDEQQHQRPPSPPRNSQVFRSESDISLTDRDNLGARLDTVFSTGILPPKQMSEVSFATTIREINEDQRAEFIKMKTEVTNAFQDQMKLRRRLMEINDQAYEVAILLSSKSTVLKAWEDKQNPDQNVPATISKLKEDVGRLNQKLEALDQMRSEIEWDLAIMHKRAEKLENALPEKASTSEQRELISTLSRLHEAEIDKTVLQSDAFLLNRLVQRQEKSLEKVRGYHTVCDQLITSMTDLNGENVPEEVAKLQREHKAIKNQANYHMLPLTGKAAEMSNKSWNRTIMEKERAKTKEQKLSKTLNSYELERLKSEQRLNEPQKESTNGSVRLPPINTQIKGNTNISRSKDDSSLRYDMKEISLDTIRSKAKARRDSVSTVSEDRSRPSTNQTRPRSRSRSAEFDNRKPNSKRLSRRNSDSSLSKVGRKEKSSSRSRNPPNRRVRSPTRPHLPVLIHK